MRELPEQAREILLSLDAPPRLLAHHTMVHDVAMSLLDGLEANWPALSLDRAAVLFGAATHDVGKAIHQEELRGPGRRHEQDGSALLTAKGVPEELARYTRTHAQWSLVKDPPIEDLIVALANTIWTGARNERLEKLLIDRIVAFSGEPLWSVFAKFDDILLEILEGAGERFALYAAIPDDDAGA
jgi:HD domain